MSIRDEFRQALGLDAEFEAARHRWQHRPARADRKPLATSPDIEALRKRLEKDLVDAQDKSDADFDAANARLNILSPWYAPPTDAEVQATRQILKDALYAIRHALKKLQRAEAAAGPWYLDPGEVPGIEGGLVDQLGPGNEQRGRHDPMPILLVCRDLLDGYMETLDAARSTLGMSPTARERLVHSIASILFGGGARTKEILAVLKTKGITGVTRAALDQVAYRLRERLPQPTRAGAPREPRGTRKRP